MMMHQDQDIPAEMICPLTNELMIQPVTHRHFGYSCEESAIQLWLSTGETVCPFTGQPLDLNDFLPIRVLQDHIMDWQQACRLAAKEAGERKREEKMAFNNKLQELSAASTITLSSPRPHLIMVL